MNVEYIKDYKYKELKQYVLAYLLITVASVGLYAKNTIEAAGLLPTLFSMIAIDTLAGAICALVFVLNELWSDKSKRRIVYKNMPSDTVFSDIASGKIDAAGFDLAKAQEMYAYLSAAPANQQTAVWNDLLRKCKDDGRGNVIEAERMQLMTRDICMSTISLLIMTIVVLFILTFICSNVLIPIKMLYSPLIARYADIGGITQWGATNEQFLSVAMSLHAFTVLMTVILYFAAKIVASIIGYALKIIFVHGTPNIISRILGAVVGAVKSVASLMLILFVVSIIFPFSFAKPVVAELDKSKVASAVCNVEYSFLSKHLYSDETISMMMNGAGFVKAGDSLTPEETLPEA